MPSLHHCMSTGTPKSKSPKRSSPLKSLNDDAERGFSTSLQWFDTDCFKEAGLRDAAGQRVFWEEHKWEDFEAYMRAKHVAINKQIADTEKVIARLHNCSQALFDWTSEGNPEHRLFVELYRRPGTVEEEEQHDANDHRADFPGQAKVLNQGIGAAQQRRARLERERDVLKQVNLDQHDMVVQTKQSVKIINPTPHTRWYHGEVVQITWTFKGAVEAVDIRLASEHGAWEPLALQVPNTGLYEWDVSWTLPKSKMYRIEITGFNYGQPVVKTRSAYFSIAEERLGCGSPAASPNSFLSTGSGSAKSPISRGESPRVATSTLSCSVLLERFDPWLDADISELLLEPLPQLGWEDDVCAIDHQSKIDAVILPSGHGVCFANALEAMEDIRMAAEISAVVKLYHSPDALTGVHPRGDPSTWVSVQVPGEDLHSTRGYTEGHYRGLNFPDDSSKLSPQKIIGAKDAMDAMRIVS